MRTLVLIFVTITSLLCGCQSSDEPADAAPKNESVDSLRFDTLEYLDQFNTTWRVYVNTPEHREMKDLSTPLKYKVSALGEPKRTYQKSTDSTYGRIDDGQTIIGHVFYAQGRCLNFYPYLQDLPDRIVLMSPELVTAEVSINGNDTMVIESSCTQENLFSVEYTLPDLEKFGGKPVYFRGKRVVK